MSDRAKRVAKAKPTAVGPRAVSRLGTWTVRGYDVRYCTERRALSRAVRVPGLLSGTAARKRADVSAAESPRPTVLEVF